MVCDLQVFVTAARGRLARSRRVPRPQASQCGLTPQYEALEWLHEAYVDRGLTVIGVPCNQFGGQEPGSPEEIAEFCLSNYHVGFPLTAKLEVNGSGRHPLYEELAAAPDADGEAGEVQWNFEKFLVSRRAKRWSGSVP